MIAITGANGFVGSHLGEFLVKGGMQVVGLVRKGRENFVEYFGGRPVAVDYFDVDSLTNSLDGVEVVYHFAGITVEKGDVSFERDYLQVGRNILEACKKAGVRKIIFNSGLGVANYGKVHTSNKYFLSRLRMEEEIRKSKLAYTIFRPSTIIGSGHGLIPWDELTPAVVESLKKEQKIKIIGDGKNLFQPIFIEDVVKIYQKCIDNFDNKVFDFVGPEKISMMDYAKMIAKQLNVKAKFEFQSPEETNMTKEEIDILLLNETSDHKILEKEFGIKLTSVETAIERMFKNL